MAVYYNELDPFAAAWLRELIKDGETADGDVDERDIRIVCADDLRGYQQCHFFAGIGGWPLALRLAGWPDDRPVWTGSCPCQPFSSAGQGLGADDPRHLWPAWFRLIRECRPHHIFGEQVEAAIAHGWLDLVCDDLEGEGYATGAVSLPACSVGAFHIRQRLWWCARLLADTERAGVRPAERGRTGAAPTEVPGEVRQQRIRSDARPSGPCLCGGLAQPWTDCLWVPCRDGKARPVEPTIQPLAHGVSNRVGLLRGAGNAIVPPLAAEFIKAYLEVIA